MDEARVHISGFRMDFGDTTVVRDLSFDVHADETFGFLASPFYAVSLVVSDPQSAIVQIFTFFPFSAPVTALLRNGFGSLSLPEAAIVIAILFVGAAVMLRIAARLFQYGSISYASKVNVRTALRAGPRRTAAAEPPTAAGS